MDELPLLELFNRLRDAGLPLGIAEYQLALKALQGGFGIADLVALKRMCQTLWVKSDEEQALFDYHFERVMINLSPVSETDPQAPVTSQLSHKTRWLALAGAFVFGVGGMVVLGAGEENWIEQLICWIRPRWCQPAVAEANTTPQPTVTPQPTTTPQGGVQIGLNQNSDTSKNFEWLYWGGIAITSLAVGSTLAWWTNKLLERSKTEPANIEKTVSEAAQLSEVIQTIHDEVQLAKSVRQATATSNGEDHHITDTSEYFPITQRQMKQSWRYLRRTIREGAKTELDIDATVQQISDQGLLLEPVLVAPRINRAELLLLIDQDGSMIPFHALSKRLVETALRGGRLGKASIYYFQNCPVSYLYKDPFHQDAEHLEQFLACVPPQCMSVLIFSDAGAARGGMNPQRIEMTAIFLEKLGQRVRYIAWLNPIPKARWFGTSAGEIARMVPMLEVSRQGFNVAIDILRGRRVLREEELR